MSDSSIVMRCAVHPGRAAHDRCPVCDRPRCDEDVATYRESGCAACVTDTARRRSVSSLEATVGAAQAIVPVAVIGGWIYSQYVEVHIFSWLVPALIGIAGASGSLLRRKTAPSSPPALVGVVAGLLGTAFGFRLFPHGPHDPLHPWHEVGLPYLAAVVAAVVWPFVLGPPRKADATRVAGS